MMQIISTVLNILLLIRGCYSLEENVEKLDIVAGLGTATEFQKLLYSELHTLIRATDFANPGDTSRTQEEVDHLWQRIINHGWQTAKHGENRNLQGIEEVSRNHPFIVCNRSLQSGSQRRIDLIDNAKAHKDDLIVVYNDQEQTCYHIFMTHSNALALKDTELGNNVSIAPMTDILKIAVGTFDTISEDYWVPKFSSLKSDSWERSVRVAFSAGERVDNAVNSALTKANQIIKNIKQLGGNGADIRRRKLRNEANEKFASLFTSFSLTAMSSSSEESHSRHLAVVKDNVWEESLSNGLEASHGCVEMFDTMKIVLHEGNQGFDIILNPSNNDASERSSDRTTLTGIPSKDSSASNVNCVRSLIIALSTQPSIVSIEVDIPIRENDLQSSWISESKIENVRPFNAAGLNGNNQVVSIADSGIDSYHRYFHVDGKIVNYVTTYGDGDEMRGGHGTSVAAIVAGYSSPNDEANGVAEGASLNIIDMQVGNGMYRNPGPHSILQSSYENGAMIANGSWSTKYRAYSISCRLYDDELFGEFSDVLFVASAGNDGRDVSTNTSQERTIGNPAACKNVMAVGASQSERPRITQNFSGSDYLALFSSRGPTSDNRIKPDIVAPGFTVLTAYARPDGNDSDTVEVMGTSYSAPVVAGNAAIVRQYFEEGWFPCGSKGCGTSIKPSGALLKAVLMNGAQNLKQVQAIIPQEKTLLETVSEYDNNQGFGLVNLLKSLPLKGRNEISSFAVNDEIINDGQRIFFYVRAMNKWCATKDLSVTLAWYDTGGASGCTKCLVNDLDLFIHEIRPNGVVNWNSHRAPNGLKGDQRDDRNNVERIRFDMIHGRRYRITVHAGNLAYANIKYSLIATGCFKVIDKPRRRRKKVNRV
jgi:subtilisin family serine protease